MSCLSMGTSSMGTTKRGRDAPGRLSYRADNRCKQSRKKASAQEDNLVTHRASSF